MSLSLTASKTTMRSAASSGLLPIVLPGACHCGCGADAKPGRRYLRGHQFHKNPNCRLSKKDRKRLYDQQRYEEKRDEVLERVAKWQRANPAKVNEISNRAKRRRRWGRGSDTAAFARVLQSDPCAYCGEMGVEIDHIEPVAVGGLKDWTNLTGACRSCNARKRTRSLLTFLLDRQPSLHGRAAA